MSLKRFKKYLLVSTLTISAPMEAFAQSSRPTGNFTGVSDFFKLVQVIAQWLYAFAFAFAVIMLLWAGYLYLTAQDDEKQLTKAKQTIVYAVIGVVIAVLANGMPKLISSFLGV